MLVVPANTASVTYSVSPAYTAGATGNVHGHRDGERRVRPERDVAVDADRRPEGDRCRCVYRRRHAPGQPAGPLRHGREHGRSTVPNTAMDGPMTDRLPTRPGRAPGAVEPGLRRPTQPPRDEGSPLAVKHRPTEVARGPRIRPGASFVAAGPGTSLRSGTTLAPSTAPDITDPHRLRRLTGTQVLDSHPILRAAQSEPGLIYIEYTWPVGPTGKGKGCEDSLARSRP